MQAVSQTYPFNGDLDLDLGIACKLLRGCRLCCQKLTLLSIHRPDSSIFVLVAQTMFYGLGVYKVNFTTTIPIAVRC